MAVDANLVRAIRGPITLITLGVLFTFDHFTPYGFGQTWPVLLIVFGLLSLLRRGSVPPVGPPPDAPWPPPPGTWPPPPGPWVPPSPPAGGGSSENLVVQGHCFHRRGHVRFNPPGCNCIHLNIVRGELNGH